MKLISLNIEKNKHHKKVLAFLRREHPDVVCLQEFMEPDFELYKRELGMEGVYQAYSFVLPQPHRHYDDVIGQKQGIAVFAKKIEASDSIFYEGKRENLKVSFEEYQKNENFAKNSVLLWIDFKNKNTLIRVFTTHLPVTKDGQSTPYQLNVLESMFQALAPFKEVILCGDFNAPRGNETFTRIAEKYKDCIPLQYKTSIDYVLHRNGKEMKKENKEFMVDGLFTTWQFQASNVKLVDNLSDHMAIVAEIEKAG